MTFYEIDPEVARIARDPALFTYLANSAAAVDVRPGDGRLALARAPAGTHDVIAVDAFTSDAIPVHLLNREAVEASWRGLYASQWVLLARDAADLPDDLTDPRWHTVRPDPDAPRWTDTHSSLLDVLDWR